MLATSQPLCRAVCVDAWADPIQVDAATAEVAAAVRGKCPGSGVDGDVDVDVDVDAEAQVRLRLGSPRECEQWMEDGGADGPWRYPSFREGGRASCGDWVPASWGRPSRHRQRRRQRLV